MWPVRGSAIHVETERDAALAPELPVRVVCDSCGEARALSTITAVLVGHEQAAARDPDYRPEDSESVWIRQTEDFREHHVCRPAPEGREESS
jgi:hypothetical protein